MVKSGFFNSIDNDRTYDADDISNYFLKLISNGVFVTPASNLKVSAAGGMNVTVAPGWAFINCKWLNNTANVSLELDAADTINTRKDRIMVGLDTEARTISIYVRKGIAAANPTPPALIRSDTVYELCLATISIAANASTISQADITDDRANTVVCGYVTGLIDQIDTTDLFAQFTDAFNTWFANLQETLVYNARVERYYSRFVTTEASTSSIPLNIPAYNPLIDMVSVFVNGLKLTPNTDYTINDTLQSVELTQALDVVGTVVLIEVLRSKGEQVGNIPVHAIISARTIGQPVLGNLEELEE